jgi:hypothetical protein
MGLRAELEARTRPATFFTDAATSIAIRPENDSAMITKEFFGAVSMTKAVNSSYPRGDPQGRRRRE